MNIQKLEKFQNLLKQKELSGIFVLNYVDFIYFTGSIQGNLLFIPCKGTPLFFTRRAYERAQKESTIAKVISFKSYKEVYQVLKENHSLQNKTEKYGFLFDSTPVNLFQKVAEDLNIEPQQIVDFSSSLKNFKMVKEPYEIEKIKKAGAILEKSYQQLPSKIHSQMSELEIAFALESLLKENGHLGENRFRGFNQIGLLTYIVNDERVYTPTVHDTPYGGLGSSFAMGVGASSNKINPTLPFMADTVGNFEGYHNDCTRTFTFGKPSDLVKRNYQALQEIYHYAKSLLKPGALCEDIYFSTLEKAKNLGYQDSFMGLKGNQVGFLGHGIGIQVDEFPVLAPKLQIPLEPNMTIAIEPKLFLKEIGGVGLETTFLITEKGAEPLCNLTEDIIVIEK